MKYQAVLLFGLPGVGKGTQGEMLGAMQDYYHFSSGDMFRALDPISDLGQEVNCCMQEGIMVSDELTMRLFKDRMSTVQAAGEYYPDSNYLLLDGIPRNATQPQLLDEIADVNQIIYLDAQDTSIVVDRIVKRGIEKGRKDDQDPATVQNRIEVYQKETLRVLEHYSPDLVVKIDGTGTIEEVQQKILSQLLTKSSAKITH
jgi:adenylate kinase